MIRHPSGLSAIWAIGALLLLIAGCAESPPTQYYVLNAMVATGQATTTEQGIAVGVGPVELPEHLDRPQIVTRSSQNALNLADFDRWAEPLKDNVTQVLAENLAQLLPSKRVVVYPWKRATPIEYSLQVKVIRFDRESAGDSMLKVRWSLTGGADGKVLLNRESSYSERPAGADFPATVVAMNQTLTAFSRDIATAIKELQGAR